MAETYNALPDARRKEILETFRRTKSVRETARICGCHDDTVRKYGKEALEAEGGKPQVPTHSEPARKPTTKRPEPITDADVEAMRLPAEHHTRPECDYEEDEDSPEVLWKIEEEKSAKKIRKLRTRGTFRWTAPGPHLLLCFISDHHIDGGSDMVQMRMDADLIRTTPNCYAILGGDAVNNHIKHRGAMVSSEMTPENQYKLYSNYLGRLADRCLLQVSGNHDDWTKQFAGVDLLGRILREQRVCFNPSEAYMDIKVGSQTYVIGVRHQFRMNSSFNQTHSVKQWLRLGQREFDIGCVGHHHEHAIESFIYREKLRWGCRPGSYQYSSTYSEALGYNPSQPTCPAFLLRGDTFDIQGFPTVRAAIKATATMRELGIGV